MSPPFTSHLRTDEHILWSTSISDALVRKDIARQRLIAIGIFLPSTIVAALLTVVFLGSIAPRDIATPDAMLAPVYFAFGLAIAVLAIAQLFKLARPRKPEATRYAATNQRLIALDAAGAITAEMPAAEIGDVVASGLRPALFVLNHDDASEATAFPIRFIDRPLEAKAILEDTYLAPSEDSPPDA